MASQREILDQLLAHHDKAIADAFIEAMENLKANVNLGDIIRALSNNDIVGAIAAMNLDPAALNVLARSIEDAYNDGGNTAASFFPPIADETGAKVVIRFNIRNPTAEAWVRNRSSSLVTAVVEEQRENIQIKLEEGLRKGDNPTTTALDIVGRIDKATGVRSGSIIGLTGQQLEFVGNSEAELAGGDLSNYFKRTLRDKRFDRTIAKAQREGTGVPADVADKAIRSYKNRLLKFRGDMIGRTESLTALRTAENETYRQAIERGDVDADTVLKDWDSAGDRKVRDTHVVLDGQVRTFFEPFKSSSGALLMFPGDVSLGAGAAEIVHCRCRAKYRVDFLAPFRNQPGG